MLVVACSRSGERPLRRGFPAGFRVRMSLPNTALPGVLVKVVPPRPSVHEDAPTPRSRPSLKPSLPSRIAVIGNYLPRHCGIATFTTDLCSAISAEYGTARLLALPVNDTEQG